MRNLIVALLCLAIGLPSFAAGRREELVAELLVLSKADEQAKVGADVMLAQMEEELVAMFANGSEDEADLEDAKKSFDRFRELVREKVDFKSLTTEMYGRLYPKYFTDRELEDLVAFYKTPTGQKTITVLPAMVTEAAQEAGKRAEAMMMPVVEQVRAEGEKRRPWIRTMADIRWIATAMEAYATDQNQYPRASDIAGLKKFLEPTYSKRLPAKDVWGNPYAIVVSADGQHYRVVSAGADGIFEWDSRRIVASKEGEEPETKYAPRLEDDIIFADGRFLQMPQAAAPKED